MKHQLEHYRYALNKNIMDKKTLDSFELQIQKMIKQMIDKNFAVYKKHYNKTLN